MTLEESQTARLVINSFISQVSERLWLFLVGGEATGSAKHQFEGSASDSEQHLWWEPGQRKEAGGAPQ